MPDQPTDVERTGAFAALDARARRAGRSSNRRPVRAAGNRAVFQQNRWAASRFGPRAELIHPDRDGDAVSATDLYAELVERIGVDPLGRRRLRGGRAARVRRSARSDGGRRAPLVNVGAVTTETMQVTGIRCERCVMRLGKALEGHDGLEFANANLMGQVMLSYDEERTTLDALLEKMSSAGFRPVQSLG